MTMRDEALERLSSVPEIDLAELERLAPMSRRTDRKYVLSWDVFTALVEQLAPDHRVLEIDGRRVFNYDTLYFDSDELATFQAHVRGRRRRFKVRIRHYRDSGTCSLELKLKGHRGMTVKHRLPYAPGDRQQLTTAAGEFLDDCLRAAYGEAPPADLRPVLRTHYRRVTLVASDGGERMTCDFDLAYPSDDALGPAMSAGHVIVEAKSRDGRGRADRVLRQLGQRPVPCSKYLLGIGLRGLRPVPNDLRRLAGRYFVTNQETAAHG